METVKSKEELTKLRRRRARLLKLLGALVEARLDQASKEYRDATEAIEDANKAIAKAIQKLEKVAAVLKRLGQALDLVAKLVA